MNENNSLQQEDLNRRFNEAVRRGEYLLAAALTFQGAAVDAVDGKGRTALGRAAEKGDNTAIDFLLSCGADPHHRDQDGNTPLHLVPSNPSSHWEKAILALAAATRKPDLRNKRNETPLAEHIRSGTPAVVSAIVATGADVNQVDYRGASMLYHAALSWPHDVLTTLLELGYNEQMIKFLLSRGADPSCHDGEDNTPLHLILKTSSPELLKEREGSAILIAQAMPDADVAGQYGCTPLHWAAIRRNKRMIRFLLSRGADPHRRDMDDNTPLHFVLEVRPPEISVKEWEEAAILLAQATSVPDLRNKSGKTPLEYAVINFAPAAVRVIAAAGADVHQEVNVDGKYPAPLFYEAARYGQADILKTLLSHGADPGARCEARRESALSILARHQRWELVRLLIEKGADTLCRDFNGCRIETYAHDAGRQDIVDLLQKTRDRVYARATKKLLPALLRLRK